MWINQKNSFLSNFGSDGRKFTFHSLYQDTHRWVMALVSVKAPSGITEMSFPWRERIRRFFRPPNAFSWTHWSLLYDTIRVARRLRFENTNGGRTEIWLLLRSLKINQSFIENKNSLILYINPCYNHCLSMLNYLVYLICKFKFCLETTFLDTKRIQTQTDWWW